jgi:hypothetical protein
VDLPCDHGTVTDSSDTDRGEDEQAPLVLASVGSVLLVVAGAVTFVVGVLTPLLTGCAEADYGPAEPLHCRNTGAVTKLLTLPVLLIMPAGLLLTWLRLTGPYRPRAWAPVAGLGALGALWVIGNALLDGGLF